MHVFLVHDLDDDIDFTIMKTYKILAALSFLLLLLWIPAAMDKILNFSFFVDGLHKQPFSAALADVLTYIVPAAELSIIVLLLTPRYNKHGFLISAITLAIFTNYIGTALLLSKDGLPCSCGTLISHLGWSWHFWFNVFFLAISVLGYYLHRHMQRGEITKGSLSAGSAPTSERDKKMYVKRLKSKS